MENLIHSLSVIDSLRRLNDLIEIMTEKALKPGPHQVSSINSLIRLSECREKMLKHSNSGLIKLYGWLLLNQPASMEEISNSNILPGFTAYNNSLKILERARLIRRNSQRNYFVDEQDIKIIEQ